MSSCHLKNGTKNKVDSQETKIKKNKDMKEKED
jgi:hypothetical protein